MRTGSVKPFIIIEPEGLAPIKDTGEWEEVEMGVDSGATETVIREQILSWIKTQEGLAFKRGVEYEVANGVRIPNLGEKEFRGMTEEGAVKTVTAQVCDVSQNLLSVRKVVEAGNRVVFDSEGSYIESKRDGSLTWLADKQGMYTMKLWAKKGF